MKHLDTRTFRETIMRQFKDKKVPIMGTFEITGRCNFDCKMCYVHTKPNAEFIKTERDGDWWISVMEEACNQGMLFAIITGGECLLHPDFRRIYTYLRSKGVYTSIFTNGFLLNQEMIDFLKQNPPFEIQITLYGTDDESYYQVTGARAFMRVQETILRVKEAGMNLRIAITPNPYAPGETERIVKYLKEKSVNVTVNENLHTTYYEKTNQKLADEQLDIAEKIRYLSAMRDSEPQPLSRESLPPVGGRKTEPVMGMRCSGGKTSFHITHNGYMLPCVTAYDMHAQLKSPSDFREAWEHIQKEASGFLMPVECEGCAYKKACLSCPMLRCGKVGRGHCDPKVCEMTQRLVAAGVKKLPEKE